MSKARYNNPSFLCIGYKKTGTTWLHHSLEKLPEVELPKVKECRYYWGSGDPEKVYNNIAHGPVMSRLGDMSLRWRKEYLSRSLRRYRKGVDKMTLKSVLWDMKYTFLPQSYAWYQSLFPKDKFSGDIDPHYLFFDEKIIARIKEKHSDIKILLFLRNPVELYWSLFRMWAFRIRGLDTEQMNTDFVINRLQKTVGSSPSFCETITKWSKHFDNQHFYVAYYDDLVDDPYQFLRGITDFLGLNMSSISPADLTEVVHRGVHFDMPPEVELSVYEMLLPEVKKLCQIVESPHPNRWLKTMSERQLELH